MANGKNEGTDVFDTTVSEAFKHRLQNSPEFEFESATKFINNLEKNDAAYREMFLQLLKDPSGHDKKQERFLEKFSQKIQLVFRIGNKGQVKVLMEFFLGFDENLAEIVTLIGRKEGNEKIAALIKGFCK